ncbi:MAG: flagellar basal body-associated FliL family protein, partial [Azonexus sp.]|nr:flagellar basal body-associated FliL family protein [Azonexus sp.]
MAKATKPADADAIKAPHKGKKLLLIFLAVFLLLAVIGGGFAVWLFSGHSGANGDDEYAEETVKPKKVKKKDDALPAFVNLDPFTVNLAQEGGDQYLQVVLSLELDSKESETMLKTLMPRIRN